MNFNNQLHLISCRYSLPFCVALGIGVITTIHSLLKKLNLILAFCIQCKERNTIDIRRFNYGNPIPEGKYYADIYLNNEWKGKANVQYLYTDNANTSTLCLTPELLSLIDVVKAALFLKQL